jgi:hypothetical protein
MENPQPDVLAQVPAGGGVNKPASGTYGEKAELERLEAQLPGSEPSAPVPQEVSPLPGVPSGSAVPAPPSGLPRGLTLPSRRPDVPVSTPLQGPPADPYVGAVNARQRRLALLDMLSEHPEASPELQEWAEILKQKLIARG